MTASLALRHQARPVASSREWRAGRLADGARLPTPSLRHVTREVDDQGPGTEIRLGLGEPRPYAVVARLWFGVLSIFTLIVFGGLLLIVLGAWAIGYRPVVVTSGSMAPVVRTGDVVITKPVGMHDKVGDQTVIDFDDPASTERHLHRIIEVTDAGYRTKGDANASADAAIVPQDHVRGTGFVLAPYVGYVAIWIQERAWGALAVVALLVVSLSVMSRRAWMWAGPQR